MAEVVEFRIEKDLALFEQLERNGLFDVEEIKAIVKKVKDFEYKLQRSQKRKHHILKYIAYEESLLKLIKIRRDRIGFHQNYREIETRIGKKVKTIFRRAVDKYQDDVKLWFSFINFCKEVKFVEDIPEIYTRMLQMHSNNDAVWVSAAKWHFEDNNSPDVARQLLLRGLRHIPDSKTLWSEYFRLEVMFISLIQRRRDLLETSITTKRTKRKRDSSPQDDPILSGKLAMTVVKNAIKSNPDVKLVVSFLKILDDFKPNIRLSLKDQLYNILETQFGEKEECWNEIATRFIDKSYMKHVIESQSNETRSEANSLLQDAKKTFEKAVSLLKTEKMWSCCIKFYLETLSKSGETTVLKEVLSAMERAWNENLLKPDLFIEWILLLKQSGNHESKKFATELVRKGTEKWSYNAKVSYVCLSCLAEEDATFKPEVKKLFERSIKRLENVETEALDREDDDESFTYTLGPKSLLDIWNLYLNWATLALSSADVLSIIEKACVINAFSGQNLQRHREIATFLKLKLLEKSMEFGDKAIEKARHYYEKYKNQHPIIPSFFTKMMDFEMNEDNPRISNVQRIFNDYVEHFGDSDYQAWINLIRFLLSNKKCHEVAKTYYSACKRLKPEECDKFMSEYSLLQAEGVGSFDTE